MPLPVSELVERLGFDPAIAPAMWRQALTHKSAEGAQFVEPGGHIALEVGAGQSRQVAALFESQPDVWEKPVIREDISRIERVVTARRRPV